MFSTKRVLKLVSLCVLLFSLSNNIYSQSTGIKGIVTDEAKIPLEMVSVAVLSPKDNSFLSFTTTDEKGMFLLKDIPKDSIVIQLNLLGFAQYSKKLVYKKKLIDLKTIVLKEDVSTLDEIVIAAVIPIQIKKDTVSFNANSFKVNYDDNIEGLLNKLPGIELEEGKIVAQGTTVTKIFVDGKEFFGGDPSIVLKNISADAIAKIEVIDKKSDEAELTGVNDGNKEVVINFTLKKSKKNRGFGKVAAGLGLDNRYFSNLNYNQFNSESQLSVIGKFNNINITGSNIQGFLENADGIADDSGDDSEDDFNKSQKSLSGFLKTAVAGIHYGKELKKKEDFNIDYFYNLSENNGVSNTNRVFFSRTNNFNYKSDNSYLNTSDNHNLNFNYNNKSNKTNSLRIKGRFYSDKRASNLNREGFYYNNIEELVTTNNRISENTNLKEYGNINLNYYQKLAKKGRSFNTGFNIDVNNSGRNSNQNTFITRNINQTNPSNTNFEILRDEDLNAANIFIVLVSAALIRPLGLNFYYASVIILVMSLIKGNYKLVPYFILSAFMLFGHILLMKKHHNTTQTCLSKNYALYHYLQMKVEHYPDLNPSKYVKPFFVRSALLDDSIKGEPYFYAYRDSIYQHRFISFFKANKYATVKTMYVNFKEEIFAGYSNHTKCSSWVYKVSTVQHILAIFLIPFLMVLLGICHFWFTKDTKLLTWLVICMGIIGYICLGSSLVFWYSDRLHLPFYPLIIYILIIGLSMVSGKSEKIDNGDKV